MKPIRALRMRGFYLPSWHTMRDTTPSGLDDVGWHNFTLRLRYTAAGLTDILGASQFRITVQGANAGGIKIAKLYVGLEGGTNFNFNGSQVQALFSGAAGVTIAAGLNTVITDPIAIAIDGTAPIVLSFFFANDASFDRLYRQGASNSASAYKAGDDAATTNPTGYTTTALLQDMPMKFEALA